MRPPGSPSPSSASHCVAFSPRGCGTAPESALQAFQIAIQLFVAGYELVPVHDFAAIGRGATEDRDQIAAHTLGHGRVGAVLGQDALVERRDIGDGPLLVDGRRFASPPKIISADQPLPP